MAKLMHTLQDLLLDASADRRSLYWRVVGPSMEGVTAPMAPAGGFICFDTFLNSFYERYWRDLTDLTSLGLDIEVSGPCTIRICRWQEKTGQIVVAQSASTGSRRWCQLLISLETMPANDAVIHVEVEAHGETASVHQGRWITEKAPVNPVALALVYCSFGRQAELAATLARIASEVARTDGIQRVTIVDQSTQSLRDAPGMAELLTGNAFAGKLHIVRQDNFGGAGGFTRGIIEAVQDHATHVVLLDDDTDVDPNIFVRLCTLLGHIGAEVTIGGQMLNIRSPLQLSASHESVDLAALTLHNPMHRTDLSAAGSPRLFASRHLSGYNGWWLCCLPVSVIERVGLPLPLFIRHDDIEYGTRCRLAGSQIVTMPGIFVWHEPFEAGRAPWISYYDRRNLMIVAAVHGRLKLRSVLAWYGKDLWSALAQDHFGFVIANCLAVEDYLAGPDHVFLEPAGRHLALRNAHARYSLLAATLRRSRDGRVPTQRPSAGAHAKAMLRYVIDAVCGERQAARMARTILRLYARAAIDGCRLIIFHWHVARQYRFSAKYYITSKFWFGYLGIEPRNCDG